MSVRIRNPVPLLVILPVLMYLLHCKNIEFVQLLHAGNCSRYRKVLERHKERQDLFNSQSSATSRPSHCIGSGGKHQHWGFSPYIFPRTNPYLCKLRVISLPRKSIFPFEIRFNDHAYPVPLRPCRGRASNLFSFMKGFSLTRALLIDHLSG